MTRKRPSSSVGLHAIDPQELPSAFALFLDRPDLAPWFFSSCRDGTATLVTGSLRVTAERTPPRYAVTVQGPIHSGHRAAQRGLQPAGARGWKECSPAASGEVQAGKVRNIGDTLTVRREGAARAAGRIAAGITPARKQLLDRACFSPHLRRKLWPVVHRPMLPLFVAPARRFRSRAALTDFP